jgi:alpha-ribazole phosphatase
MKLVLIRHTSVDVAPGVCYGQSDVDTAATFPEEAEKVRSKLAGYEFDKVFSSPLTRCRKLAAHCGYADAQIDKRLAEMNFGEWELQRYDDITDPQLWRWYEDYVHERPTGGESFLDQQQRFASFLAELKETDYKCVAAFAHAGILMHARVLCCGYTVDEAVGERLGYGSIIEVEV